jgi:Calcineurin-like phosphoesterase
MPQHHNGLIVTDIKITQCSSVNVFSSCELDSGKWHRIEKDLFLSNGWVSSAYVHVARKKEEELTPEDRVVMDVYVGKLDPSTGQKGEADEIWETRSGGLWIKRSSQRKASDSQQAITAVDVLFGDDAVEARDGWYITGTPLLLDVPNPHHVPHLTVRRGSQHQRAKPQPRIKDNGKFKIMQVSDMHLSTGVGTCRDALPDGPCEADRRTLDFISKLLEQEKPDLVVLSGDQINGDTAPDAQSVSQKTLVGHHGI